MIIKSTRVPAGQTRQLSRYLSEKGENEKVSWVKGNYSDILTMGEISKLAGKVFAVRHFSISPNERMAVENLAIVIQEICREFDVPETSTSRMVIVEHKKRRVSGENNGIHWHLAVPEVHTESLKTLSSSFYKMRNEKVSRICELRLGHPVVAGRFTKQVASNLHGERPDLFAQLSEVLSGALARNGDNVTSVGR